MSTTSATEIAYRYLDSNRAEKHDVCRGLSEGGAAAIAAEALDATELSSGDYIYFARESGEHYVVTSAELAAYGAAIHCRNADSHSADHYSVWCSGAGRPATETEVAEIVD